MNSVCQLINNAHAHKNRCGGDCAICLTSVSNNPVIECEHDSSPFHGIKLIIIKFGNFCYGFHQDCIHTWLKKRNVCPLYKGDLLSVHDHLLARFNVTRFHQDCIHMWLMERNLCPLCNEEWNYVNTQRFSGHEDAV